ncbi:hypothetical protein AXK11_03320 [Cephaloticoccus primus]|uniref:Helix-turn-helix domain-containing protein n=1 Tax=Cephaloticoccus primus TaxID=1548207 RepID=A0A139SQM4_9BACT|nr:helix-turn-helix domain-containing protein [Cephaloticoccus primus]KXU36837.1 hypothetical protein AXK11_03320 [Cephaloticoccus primus]
MPLAQTATAELPPPSRTVDVGELIDPSRESFSIAEAAAIVDHQENVMYLLCREGVVPTYEVDGELRIKRADLIAYYREETKIRERLRRDPFIQAMNALNDELMDAGLY